MSEFEKLVAVAVGGALGAIGRFLMVNAIYAAFGRDFPWGTLAVNVLGSAVMGFAFAYLIHRADSHSLVQPLLVAGLLGAFTTFSTFSIETVVLIEAGQPIRALTNMMVSVVLCVGVCWLGLLAGRQAFAVNA